MGVLFAIALVTRGIFGPDGLFTYLQKRREYLALHQQIDRIKRENKKLQKEVQGLKSNPTTIERYAREDLNMARKHEIIYTLPRHRHDSANANLTQRSNTPPHP